MSKYSYREPRITRAVARTFAILKLLGTRSEMDVAAVCEALSIPRSSAYNLIGALSTLGYLTKRRDGTLTLTEQSRSALEPPGGGPLRTFEAVSRALEILSLLGQGASSPAALSRATGVDEATVSTLLQALRASRFAEPDGGNGASYRLGPRVFELHGLPQEGVLPGVALPALRDLANKTRETVKLAVARSGKALVVYAIESPRALRTRSDFGAVGLLHGSAVGKALLAFLPEDEARRALSAPLRRLTPNTVVRPQALQAELQLVRRRGWSFDDEETDPGVRCVGAPILTPEGFAAGSISVSGPAVRITDSVIPRLSRLVMAAAREISRRLARVNAASRGGEGTFDRSAGTRRYAAR